MDKVFLHKKDVPKSCFDCPFMDETTDFPNIFCIITDELINDEMDIVEQRHKTCPLKALEGARS